MPKDVDQAALSRLLDLQAEDTAITRLHARKESLPEARRLREVQEQMTELDSDLSIATKQGEEIARNQARIEADVAGLEEKIIAEEKRLFTGGVANPRELSALQAEVEMLKRRRGEREDKLLEIMVERDRSRETTQRVGTEHREVLAASAELGATVERLVREIDTELAEHSAARTSIASELPDHLLSLFDRLSASKGGVGAAALVDGTCQGCHTKLPSKEVERLHAESGLQRCDNCRRILVIA